MVGKWSGCIHPMCSKPGHSWHGLFCYQKSDPFHKKFIFSCLYYKTFLFIIKKARPRGLRSATQNHWPCRPRNKDAWWNPHFFPIPLFLWIFQWKMVRGGFKCIDLGIAVIFVVVFFGKHHFLFSKLAGMLDFGIFQWCFENMCVKSYPFED